MLTGAARGLLALVFVLCASIHCHAEVTRFEIVERAPFADGHAFGGVGPYERIAGRVHYAIDPSLPQNRRIVDLDRAPRNENGRAEFDADIFILAPAAPGRGNGAILYDVNNRGNKLALRFFNEAAGENDPRDFGNAFLLERGYTVVWSGWNAEVQPGDSRMRLHAPIARDGDEPITGIVRYEISPDEPTDRLPANREDQGAYAPTERGLREATLTWRLHPGDRRVPIPREQFGLHVAQVESALPTVELELPAGFRTGYLYELIYEAQDPLVHGVCFAAVRDLLAALRHGEGEENPFGATEEDAFELAYGFGVSQSGRFLREFLSSGFNEDESGRIVFDGLMPHVAGAGVGSFNHRFAQPTAFCTQRELHDWPVDRFPFSYHPQVDPQTERSDSLLAAAEATGTAPKVFHTQTATEYWSRAGSLVHTDPLGKRDEPPPPGVRIFAFGGTQHGPASWPPASGPGQTLANSADYRPFLRGLLVALDEWCRDGIEPPRSVFPSIAEKTLIAHREYAAAFPAVPGNRPPIGMHTPLLLDLGKRWKSAGIIDLQPPRPAGEYRALVPACDQSGNDRGCLLPPEVAVPVATYTGWSLRSREAGGENDLVGLAGSYIPFPADADERQTTGDPRMSLAERYGGQERYLQQLAEECLRLEEGGFLLKGDIDAIVERQRERTAELFH